jgi:branched-chain amino acid transport system ATP-binding protein
MNLLEIKDITIHYERVEAIKGISVQIEKGSIVTLIGSNGAGKTSILRTIFGLKNPTTGEIWFEGRRIDKLPPQEIARIGIAYTMEGRRLFPRMTVLENLEMGAYFRADKKEVKSDIEEIYEHFPILSDRRNQEAGTLSGGEQQMLAIGRALMGNPSLLLLDEPSLGLAPKIVQELSTIIKDINKRGVSILLVEQNSKLALGVAQKGYVLEVGKVVLEGDAEELLRNDHVRRVYLGV